MTFKIGELLLHILHKRNRSWFYKTEPFSWIKIRWIDGKMYKPVELLSFLLSHSWEISKSCDLFEYVLHSSTDKVLEDFIYLMVLTWSWRFFLSMGVSDSNIDDLYCHAVLLRWWDCVKKLNSSWSKIKVHKMFLVWGRPE